MNKVNTSVHNCFSHLAHIGNQTSFTAFTINLSWRWIYLHKEQSRVLMPRNWSMNELLYSFNLFWLGTNLKKPQPLLMIVLGVSFHLISNMCEKVNLIRWLCYFIEDDLHVITYSSIEVYRFCVFTLLKEYIWVVFSDSFYLLAFFTNVNIYI